MWKQTVRKLAVPPPRRHGTLLWWAGGLFLLLLSVGCTLWACTRRHS